MIRHRAFEEPDPGQPSGWGLTHGNMAASLRQLAAWIAHGLQDGSEVFVCPLPLYPHVAEGGAVGKLDER